MWCGGPLRSSSRYRGQVQKATEASGALASPAQLCKTGKPSDLGDSLGGMAAHRSTHSANGTGVFPRPESLAPYRLGRGDRTDASLGTMDGENRPTQAHGSATVSA